MSDRRTESLRWLRQAEADLRAGQHLVDAGDFNVACFMAQQAAEKAIKGYLRACGEMNIYGHSVRSLCEWAGESHPAFRDIEDEVATLDTYYIPTRYPDALPDIIPAEAYNSAAASGALEIAEKVLEAVRKLLG
jgi:HEPN domain-containing protein